VAELLSERIRRNAAELKLPALAEHLDELVARAEEGQMGYRELVDLVLEEEVGVLEGRRCASRLKLSGLPHHKTFDDFELAFQPELDPRRVAELRSLRFLERRAGVLLLGPPGVVTGASEKPGAVHLRIRAHHCAPGQVAGAASTNGLMRPTNHLGLPDRVLPEPLSRNLVSSYDVRPERGQCSGSILMPVHHYSGLDLNKAGGGSWNSRRPLCRYRETTLRQACWRQWTSRHSRQCHSRRPGTDRCPSPKSEALSASRRAAHPC